MKEKSSSKERILKNALEEFAEFGFGGARVDRIANKAEINKAMIFYYFKSKENLYKTLLYQSLSVLISRIQEVLSRTESPEVLIESLPGIYIRFIAANPDLFKMIALELIQNPEHIVSLVSEIFRDIPFPPQEMFGKKISAWYQEGLISEKDPIQFMMNVVPLSIFSVLGKPMVEAIFSVEIEEDQVFLEKRILSINNLLKRGMLR